MYEIYLTRLHELTVLLYATSVLLYFIDFLQRNRKANQIAFWLLVFVWGLQTVFLILFMYTTGRFPVLTVAEGLYFYTWVLVSLSLFFNRFLKFDFIVFFTNVLGFIIFVIFTFTPMEFRSDVIVGKLYSELLLIHIVMAFIAYGALSISSVFSLLYLIQYNLLKKKRWGERLVRIPDLSKLEKASYILNLIGVPILFMSLVLGLQWAFLKITDVKWYDAKIIGSYIVLLSYCAYLYLFVKKKMYGRSLAMWNAGSFLVILINFFLFGQLSSFHFWHP